MRPLPIVASPEGACDEPTPASSRPDLTDGDLQSLMEAFYARVIPDPLLSRYFAGIDMRAHIPRIADFWSTLLFHTGRYDGNAFAPHLRMPDLAAEHFARWLAMFEATVDERYDGEVAWRIKELAHRIALSMQIRLRITPVDMGLPDESLADRTSEESE